MKRVLEQLVERGEMRWRTVNHSQPVGKKP
jgi:hypothetical protein